MKKIITPSKKEESEYYCDFTGKKFQHNIPEVEIKLSFNYGSKFDDSGFEFHFEEKEINEILLMIRSKLSKKTKKKIKSFLKDVENKYDDSINFREWDSCDFYASNIEFYKFLLNEKIDFEE